MPHEKLDKLMEEVQEIKISIAKQREQEAAHQRNIERFWTQTWPKVEQQISDNQTKIAELEIKVAQLQTKVMIWGTTLMVGAPILLKVLDIFIKG